MGAPMLRALRDAGFDARGLDVRAPAEFGDLADLITNDAGAFSDRLTTLISVVRDVPQTEDVLWGAQNVVGKAQELDTVIVSSTLSPRFIRSAQERLPPNIALIDAPMSGAQVAAENRSLTFMLGGSAEVLDKIQPLFDAMGATFFRMGATGAGMQAKVLNNLLAASHTAMTRLVLNWADDAGLAERDLLDLINASSGQNWLASGFDEIEFARDGLADDNSIGILVKDVKSALDAAPKTADLSLPHALITALEHLKPRQK
ncbi:3-hydroxyisobutyrate dehydrogenase [Litoreibacter roseus]|uniref:3-hydroxyisobutyrate dehydrogenase n=2 Tax=Litoreibacter roseus TaxID=2601869 RepID=A0A6N6JJE8_9RHOB|nr:3-hydroxyisobutyrate dehydrogenase [Litoreibacter roseus]